jgi:hypothetical protein
VITDLQMLPKLAGFEEDERARGAKPRGVRGISFDFDSTDSDYELVLVADMGRLAVLSGEGVATNIALEGGRCLHG